jgi:nucleotide-binding universal stress UspA family protein
VVTVLFVFDPGEVCYETPDPFSTDAELTELATERADRVFTTFEVPGKSDTTVRTVHEVGHPGRTVVDHVVVGSHGREGALCRLLGSVVENILRRSPVSVTVVQWRNYRLFDGRDLVMPLREFFMTLLIASVCCFRAGIDR